MSLLGPCPAPDADLSTNGGLAAALEGLRRALQACDDDKTALREWSKEQSK